MGKAIRMLGTKFCHDIASPINALGLILEMLDSEENRSNLALAKQSQGDLVHLLNLYRILLAPHVDDYTFKKAIQWIQDSCERNQITFTLQKPLVGENSVGILSLYAYLILNDGIKDRGDFFIQSTPLEWLFRLHVVPYKPNKLFLALLHKSDEVEQDSSFSFVTMLIASANHYHFLIEPTLGDNEASIKIKIRP